jgi:hypothetical protein
MKSGACKRCVFGVSSSVVFFLVFHPSSLVRRIFMVLYRTGGIVVVVVVKGLLPVYFYFKNQEELERWLASEYPDIWIYKREEVGGIDVSILYDYNNIDPEGHPKKLIIMNCHVFL